MAHNFDSTHLEGRARRYFGDGLADIAVGLALLCAGAGLLLDLAAFGGVWVALMVPLMQSAKKNITVPRLPKDGAPLSEPRRLKLLMTGVLVGLVLLVAVGLTLFALPEASAGLRAGIKTYGGPLLGLLGAIALTLVGWASDARRFYAYAALPLFAVAGSYWINLDFPVHLILVGAVILLAGLVTLIRFVRAYPLT